MTGGQREGAQLRPAPEPTRCPLARVENGDSNSSCVPGVGVFASVGSWRAASRLHGAVFVRIGGGCQGGSALRCSLCPVSPGDHCLAKRPLHQERFHLLGLGRRHSLGCWNIQMLVGTVTLKVEALEYLTFLSLPGPPQSWLGPPSTPAPPPVERPPTVS